MKQANESVIRGLPYKTSAQNGEEVKNTEGIGYHDYHLMTNIGNNDYFPDSRFKMPFYYIRNIA